MVLVLSTRIEKKIVNTCFHEEDFGVSAEWHFFATSHGKGPCDGIGGTTKRLATKVSLQPGQDPITTHRKLFTWAQHNITNITFNIFTVNHHKQECDILEARYENR